MLGRWDGRTEEQAGLRSVMCDALLKVAIESWKA